MPSRSWNSCQKELDRYLKDLDNRAYPNNVNLWKACRYKLLGICVASGWDKKWPLNNGARWFGLIIA